MKIKYIYNTNWISNIFPIGDDVYFVDSKLNSKKNTIICVISKKDLIYGVKNNKDSLFLSYPLIDGANIETASKTNLNVVMSVGHYIQNLFKVKNKLYYTILVDDKTNTFDINNEKISELENMILLLIIKDTLFFKNIDTNQICLFDFNFHKLDTLIKLKCHKIIEINGNYAILEIDNRINLYNSNFELIKNISDDSDFKSIEYLNKNNIIISYLEIKKTEIINVKNLEKQTFCENYLYRMINIDEKFLIGKEMYDSEGNENLSLPIIIYQ